MKTQCKPCIHISMMWKLAKIHWRNYWADVNSHKNINMTACRIDEMPVSSFVIEPAPEVKRIHAIVDSVKKIRKANAAVAELEEEQQLRPEEIESLVERYKAGLVKEKDDSVK